MPKRNLVIWTLLTLCLVLAAWTVRRADKKALPSQTSLERSAAGQLSTSALEPPKFQPGTIVNADGVARTGAYASIPERDTTDHPYGPLPEENGSERSFSTRAELIQAAKAAILVDVVSISSPHFNSDDGGFYVSGGSPPIPVQDVRLRIRQKWADLTGLPSEFDLTVPGGQIEVEISEEQAERARAAEALYQESGKHVIGFAPTLHLRESETAILLLAPFKMAWEGGSKEVMQVILGDISRFEPSQDQVKNEKRPEWSGPEADLRQEISREIGKRPIPS